MFAIFFLNVSRKLMLLIFTIRVSRLAFLITIRSPVFIGTRVSPSKYAMRLAHYPHNEEMAKLADELGLLLWEEIPV